MICHKQPSSLLFVKQPLSSVVPQAEGVFECFEFRGRVAAFEGFPEALAHALVGFYHVAAGPAMVANNTARIIQGE